MFNISIQIIIKRLVFCTSKTDPFSLFHGNALFSGLPVFVTVTFFYLIFKAKTLNSQLTPFLLSSTLFLSFSLISYTYVLHVIVAFTTAKKLQSVFVCCLPYSGCQLLFSQRTRIYLCLQFQRNNMPLIWILNISSQQKHISNKESRGQEAQKVHLQQQAGSRGRETLSFQSSSTVMSYSARLHTLSNMCYHLRTKCLNTHA